jgi:predicted nucleic acid-binding protein
VKPKIYLETTIPSLLTAWPSRDLIIAANQQVMQEWWQTRRKDFDLFVSELVLQESAQGDAVAAAARWEVLRRFPVLDINADVERTAKSILRTGLIPAKAANDALHLAIAAVHRMHFLLTWNCRHLANAALSSALTSACRQSGFEMPVICTPNELMVKPQL